MPQATTVTLNSVAYNPQGTQNGVTTWRTAPGLGGERGTLTESVRGPLQNGMYRNRFVLLLPAVREEDTPCGCAGSLLGTAKADIVVDVPATFSATLRADLLDRIQALVTTAAFEASVEDLEGTWG